LINGGPYEAAIEVTPLGPFVPNPDIPIPPQVEHASESDDLYNLDESNDNDNEEKDENDGDEARPTPSATTSLHFDGYIPEFWGVRYTEGPDRPERNNLFQFMLSSHVYYSEQSNSVFTGQSASDASLYERDYAGAY